MRADGFQLASDGSLALFQDTFFPRVFWPPIQKEVFIVSAACLVFILPSWWFKLLFLTLKFIVLNCWHCAARCMAVRCLAQSRAKELN